MIETDDDGLISANFFSTTDGSSTKGMLDSKLPFDELTCFKGEPLPELDFIVDVDVYDTDGTSSLAAFSLFLRAFVRESSSWTES